MRYLLFFSYDGSDFSGSAIQPNKKTVIGAIKEAFEKSSIYTANLTQSSRTDKGVHGLNQTAHIDIEGRFDCELLRRVVNNALPRSVHIKKIVKVSDNFHARFFAKKRSYRFIFKKNPTPFEARYVSRGEIGDISWCNEMLKCFIGRHDFSYFKKTGSDNRSDIREIYKAYAYKRGEYFIFYFEGNAFLRAQIRMMSAFVLEAQKRGIGVRELKMQLSKEKQFIRALAEPNGLYLVRVYYNFNDF